MERDRFRMLGVCPYPLDQQENVSGVAANMLTITDELKNAKGYEVTLVGPSISNGHNEADETLGRPFPIGMSKTNYRAGVSLNRPRAKEIVERANPDLVWFHDPFAAFTTTMMLLSAIDRKQTATDPLFHAYTRNLTLSNKTLIALGTRLGIKGFILHRLDGRAAVSPPTAEMWSTINNEKKDLYDILPNPIDIELFSPEGPIFKDWIKNGERIIFFAGRHDKRKGLKDLISAFHELVGHGRTNLKLKLTGYGDETKLIKKKAKDLGIDRLVEFLGVISKEDLARAYRTVGESGGVVVAPSIDGEAFNRVIAEARACRAKVAATNIEGHKLSYGSEEVFGQMAKAQNFEDLAKKIAEQLDLPEEESESRKAKGVLYVAENFSVSRVADKVVAHHEEVVSAKHRGERIIYRQKRHKKV